VTPEAWGGFVLATLTAAAGWREARAAKLEARSSSPAPPELLAKVDRLENAVERVDRSQQRMEDAMSTHLQMHVFVGNGHPTPWQVERQ
jgi:hypothetical protein